MILKEGDIFYEGDEMQSPMTGNWHPIPNQWVGFKVSYKNNDTIARYKIKFRRLKSTKEKKDE